MDTFIVPWFSRQEWLETYEAAFSSNIDRWKEARDTMLVWQARARKLPTGVDLTLPLIQAKIVVADPLVDDDVKSIVQASALQRFVSSVVKLPQTMYYRNQTLHKLASNVGLPAHLVDLRNEIIHGDSGWHGGCSVAVALETSYKWIRRYYWAKELHQMEIQPSEDTVSADWQQFLNLLNAYSKTVYTMDATSSGAEEIHEEVSQSAVERFYRFYCTMPKECMEAVVNHLLTPSDVQENIYKQPTGKAAKKSNCDCFFKNHIVKRVDSVLSNLLAENMSTELLLSCLLNQEQENKKMAIQWIHLIVKSFIELPCEKDGKGYCKEHLLQVDDYYEVNWKSIVQKLLNTEEEWATDLAVRIMSVSETGFSDSQVQQISSLVKLVKHEKDTTAKKKKIDLHALADAEVYDIDTIVETSEHPNSLKAAQEIKSVLQSSECAKTPLGILPHQTCNTQLYKELLLYYPGDKKNEIPMKRKRI